MGLASILYFERSACPSSFSLHRFNYKYDYLGVRIFVFLFRLLLYVLGLKRDVRHVVTHLSQLALSETYCNPCKWVIIGL